MCFAPDSRPHGQGLTLVHFSAQPEPHLTRNTPFIAPNTPRNLLHTRKTTPEQSLNAPPIRQKALTLSRKVDECKPLLTGCQVLTSLPAELGQCTALQTLDLTRCRALTSLPAAIGQCSNLRTLTLAGCKNLASLSVEMGLCRRGFHSSTCSSQRKHFL